MENELGSALLAFFFADLEGGAIAFIAFVAVIVTLSLVELRSRKRQKRQPARRP